MSVRPIISALLLAAFTIGASAETVPVRYWGDADLSGYACEPTVLSFVHRICYDVDSLHLIVLLRDTYNAYCGVDADTVESWLSASSKGRFYNQNIRSNAVDGRFAC